MTVPTDPPTVNASRLTTSHREALQLVRTRALEAYAVASATVERLAPLTNVEESLLGLALLAERLAKEAFETIDRLCTELDPDQTAVPEAIG